MNQSKAMRLFNEQYREDFNPDLFHRSEDDIIEELKKVILSCQRDRSFVIKVEQFRVIENYDEINQILYDYVKAWTWKKFWNNGRRRKPNSPN